MFETNFGHFGHRGRVRTDKMAGWADASRIQVQTRVFAGTWRSGPRLDKAPCLSGIFFDELWGLWVNMKQ